MALGAAWDFPEMASLGPGQLRGAQALGHASAVEVSSAWSQLPPHVPTGSTASPRWSCPSPSRSSWSRSCRPESWSLCPAPWWSTNPRITQTLIQFNTTPVPGGFRLTLPNSILYDFASSELRPNAQQSLALIAEVIEYFGNDPVIVIGHSDSIGSPTSNQTLSEQRAEAVVDSLIEGHNVPAERSPPKGAAPTSP